MDQAERLRNVIKLKQQNDKQNARVITITSGKGGVGKSNVAVNLAVQLQKMGKKVIIFDADFGLANVEVMFGAIPMYNMSDLLYKGMSMQSIITDGPEGIGFISGGTGIKGLSNLTKEQILYLVHCLKELDSMADFVIIDTGAGISNQVLEFVIASPEVLLVTTPDPSSLTDSYSLLKTLYHNPRFSPQKTAIRVVTNRVTSLEEGKQVFAKLESVVEQFLKGKIEHVGTIPQDAALERAIRKQKPVSLFAPASKASKAFEVLAGNVLNHECKQVEIKIGIAELFSNLLNPQS